MPELSQEAIYVWLTIGLLLMATVISRSALFLMGRSLKISPTLMHALRYAPAAALSAIVAPDLFMQAGQTDVSLVNPKLVAGIAASLFFLWTRHMLGTIVVGMLVFSVMRVAI